MSDDHARYFEAFPNWLRTLAEDANGLAAVLDAPATPTPVRRLIAGGLNYLFKSLDLVPDGIDDIGYLDDAFVLRVAAKEALGNPGSRAGDDHDILERLSGDMALLTAFLGSDLERLQAYVRDLSKGSARGRSVDDIVGKEDVRKDFVADVHGFSKGYLVPTFSREEKTLVKMRSFLSARLPQKS